MSGDVEKLVVDLTESVKTRFFGKYRGLVDDNKDPEKLGRIRAKVPEVLNDQVSGWALPCLPYAGSGSGQFMIPPPGAGVWIEFEAGDVSRPIWSGCWWQKNDLPKDNTQGETTPSLKIIRSEKGLMLTLDDSGQEITVSDKNGMNLLKIKVQENKITIKGALKAVVEAPRIELVENSTHPVVFGDQLLSYLNQLVTIYSTHIHPVELALGIFPVTPAPPVSPFPPALPSLLSLRVTTG